MRRTILMVTTVALTLLVASGVALAVTKIGTDGPDTLRGTNADDHLLGLGGNDELFAFRGDDSLLGGRTRICSGQEPTTATPTAATRPCSEVLATTSSTAAKVQTT
jgi:RTX calcium-binding nonapeptide repeat (4 copies)